MAEMANPSVGFVIERLKSIPEYRGKFEQAFQGKGPGMETVGMALASYQRTLNSADSPFDRWYYGDDGQAMDEQAIAGFRLFSGKARCVSCHTVNSDYALFTVPVKTKSCTTPVSVTWFPWDPKPIKYRSPWRPALRLRSTGPSSRNRANPNPMTWDIHGALGDAEESRSTTTRQPKTRTIAGNTRRRD